MVLMRGVWGRQPPSRYGVSRHYNYHYHVHDCHYHFYHWHHHVTILCRQHASSDRCCSFTHLAAALLAYGSVTMSFCHSILF